MERGQVVKAFIVLSAKFEHIRGDEPKEKELIGRRTSIIIIC